MSELEVEVLPVLSDNYVYLIRDRATGESAVIDPPVVEPVLDKLAEKGWQLSWILATHHHPDHTAGIAELKQKTGVQVAGPAGESDKIPGIDRKLSEDDRFQLGESEARVFDTPGHTAGHISLWFPDGKALFCADALFSLGCGRLFEGTAEQMWTSLSKLRKLPDDTKVYCGHEYTQSNASFALTVDPDNEALKKRAAEIDRQRSAGQPTIPSMLGDEKAANPFLRPDDVAIRQLLDMQSATDAEVFGEIRRRKDQA